MIVQFLMVLQGKRLPAQPDNRLMELSVQETVRFAVQLGIRSTVIDVMETIM